MGALPPFLRLSWVIFLTVCSLQVVFLVVLFKLLNNYGLKSVHSRKEEDSNVYQFKSNNRMYWLSTNY
jgi:hypothetical protein